MKSAYIFVKTRYDGRDIGETIYLSKAVAEREFAKCQADPNSPYCNHNKRGLMLWHVGELDLNDEKEEADV